MRKARRMMTLMASVVALALGTVILTSHAADQVPPPAAAVQPAAGAKPAATAGHRASLAPGNAATNTGALAGATAPKPAAGAPQVPEESATIRDDPTVAPDPKQSADNSVSFPNDI